jgi:hypothetical protein
MSLWLEWGENLPASDLCGCSLPVLVLGERYGAWYFDEHVELTFQAELVLDQPGRCLQVLRSHPCRVSFLRLNILKVVR